MKNYDVYYCVGCDGFIKTLRQARKQILLEDFSFNDKGILKVVATNVDSEQDDDSELYCMECGCAVMDYRVTKEVRDILIERWKISSVFPCRHINKDRKNEKEVITLSKLMEHLL